MKTKISLVGLLLAILLLVSVFWLKPILFQAPEPSLTIMPTSPPPSTSPEPTAYPSASMIPTQEPTPSEKLEDNTTAMYGAYFSVLLDLIDRYPIGEMPQKGFARIDLIDFDSDGVEEMVCIYSDAPWYETAAYLGDTFPIAGIYQFSDNQAQLVFERRSGLGSDNGVFLEYVKKEGQTYLCVGSDIYYHPEIHLCTFANGDFVEEIFVSEKNTIFDENAPPPEYFNSFISGEPVSGEEFGQRIEEYGDLGWRNISKIYDLDTNFYIGDYQLDNLLQTLLDIGQKAGHYDETVTIADLQNLFL